MRNFFLIDQSLKGIGGHHYDYSWHVTKAAVEQGNRVVLGCHRKFAEPEEFSHCEVRNPFQFTTYARSSRMSGIQQMVQKRGNTSTENAKESRLERDRQKRIRCFADDCRRFFAKPFKKSDVVFFTTLSDLEAIGLYQFLLDRPDARAASWHLQFHFPLLKGRVPQNEDLAPIQKVFRQLESLRRDMSIHYYVTSATLKHQYQQLGFEFEELAYPINPEFGPENQTNAIDTDNIFHPNDFRIALAGATRKEKGELDVAELSRSLPEFTENHQSVKIIVQQKRLSWLKRLRNFLFRSKVEWPENVQPISFPLPQQQYVQMIRQANIGLLNGYDSETYFSRRAGILGEYLAAGVPVIVPAGSWLSDQLEPLQQAHLNQRKEQASARLKPSQLIHSSDLSTTVQFKLPNSQTADPNTLPKTGKSETGNRQLILSFNIKQPSEHGNYVRITCPTLSEDKTGNNGVSEQIVSVCQLDSSNHSSLPRLVCFDLPNDCRQIEFQLSNAFEARQWEVSEIEAHLLTGSKIPRSVVGLVAANSKQTDLLLREMIQNYPHYKETADDFSRQWFELHDPRRTLEMIMTRSNSGAVHTHNKDNSTQTENNEAA